MKSLYLRIMKEVIEKFCSECGIDTESMEALIANMTDVRFKKGDVVIECGDMDDSIYIIKTGIWRSCIDRDGSELTLWFSGDSSFVVDVWCYQRHEPSRIRIVSETDSCACRISKAEIERLCAGSLVISNTIRRIFEYHAATYEESNMSLLECQTGEERYLTLLRNSPELFLRIPLNKLASYLRLTPQSLSRIRASIRQDTAD